MNSIMKTAFVIVTIISFLPLFAHSQTINQGPVGGKLIASCVVNTPGGPNNGNLFKVYQTANVLDIAANTVDPTSTRLLLYFSQNSSTSPMNLKVTKYVFSPDSLLVESAPYFGLQIPKGSQTEGTLGTVGEDPQPLTCDASW
jgi:hypothetical protein